MKLLTEENLDVEYLVEEKEDGRKSNFIQGPFICCNEKNANGRYYQLETVLPEITRYINENVRGNKAVGELQHAPTPQINLDRVCISIKELKQNDNLFIGKALVTNTPMGQVVNGLMESGVKLGVSTRALGSLSESDKGYKIVGPDLKLISVDVVAEPSGPGCWVESITENVDWVFNAAAGEWQKQLIEDQKNEIKQMSSVELSEKKVALFEDYLEILCLKHKPQ